MFVPGPSVFQLLTYFCLLGSLMTPTISVARADPEPAPKTSYCDVLNASLPGILDTHRKLIKAVRLETASLIAEEDEEGDNEEIPTLPDEETDIDTLVQKEIDLSDQLTRQFNDLQHLTTETSIKRISLEARDTSATLSASLLDKRDNGSSDEDWYSNFRFYGTKLRNEISALSHMCVAPAPTPPENAVTPGNRRGR